MSNTKELPTTQSDMVAFVDSQIDTPALQAAIEQAHADNSAAQAKLLAARQALQAHEATSPDADPQQWASTRRQLSDTLPVFERIATDRANALSAAHLALFDARKRVIAEVHQQARALASDASVFAMQRIEELRVEIEALQAGRFPAFEHANAATRALRLTESFYRQQLATN